MRDASECPTGSLGSIKGLVLLHGALIMLNLFTASVFGWVSRLDALLDAWMSDVMGETFAHDLPMGATWLMAALVGFGLPALLLSCRQSWQRLTVWMVSLAVLAMWAPVLCLASCQPEISLVCLAAAAAGFTVTFHLYWMARKHSSS